MTDAINDNEGISSDDFDSLLGLDGGDHFESKSEFSDDSNENSENNKKIHESNKNQDTVNQDTKNKNIKQNNQDTVNQDTQNKNIKNTEASDSSLISLDDPLKENSLNEIPVLRGGETPEGFNQLVERVRTRYSLLPNLDHNAICQELAILSIKACPTPTPQVLNDEIEKVQSAKDRLSEIFIDILLCYNFKKRAVDILRDAWGKFTLEKNAESRKGDAAFRLSDFLTDFADVEALLRACMHVLKNLDSLHDSLSRRITVYQLLLKMNDTGRGALPDWDYSKTQVNDDIFGDKSNKSGKGEKDSELNEDGDIELKEF